MEKITEGCDFVTKFNCVFEVLKGVNQEIKDKKLNFYKLNKNHKINANHIKTAKDVIHAFLSDITSRHLIICQAVIEAADIYEKEKNEEN